MQVITIVMIIGFAILILGLVLTEIHNHQIEVSVNRQEKRYRYQENCDMIPKEWKKYIHTEKKQGVRELKSLDDFVFVFEYADYSKGKRGACVGPTVTCKPEKMIEWFREIKVLLI